MLKQVRLCSNTQVHLHWGELRGRQSLHVKNLMQGYLKISQLCQALISDTQHPVWLQVLNATPRALWVLSGSFDEFNSLTVTCFCEINHIYSNCQEFPRQCRSVFYTRVNAVHDFSSKPGSPRLMDSGGPFQNKSQG